MKINAYLLAGDPAWLAQSVLSYYEIVDRIVVSYDESGTSWTGTELDIDTCLATLQSLDVDNKLIYAPGHYARLDAAPLQNDTYQRQCALDQASEGADWVLQVDSDEVLANVAEFLRCLDSAEVRGCDALDYPARWLYKQISADRFLEQCGRRWNVEAGYPGPIAVRAHSRLRLARQLDAMTYRVDFRRRNTDPARPRHAPVHRVIDESDGIFHFSWVRSEPDLRKKSRSSGHAYDFDWSARITHWAWCGQHPRLAVARTPLGSWTNHERLRITTVPTTLLRVPASSRPA